MEKIFEKCIELNISTATFENITVTGTCILIFIIFLILFKLSKDKDPVVILLLLTGISIILYNITIRIPNENYQNYINQNGSKEHYAITLITHQK